MKTFRSVSKRRLKIAQVGLPDTTQHTSIHYTFQVHNFFFFLFYCCSLNFTLSFILCSNSRLKTHVSQTKYPIIYYSFPLFSIFRLYFSVQCSVLSCLTEYFPIENCWPKMRTEFLHIKNGQTIIIWYLSKWKEIAIDLFLAISCLRISNIYTIHTSTNLPGIHTYHPFLFAWSISTFSIKS